MRTSTMWMTRENLAALASLTSAQRKAVRLALLEWHGVAGAGSPEAEELWRGFDSSVMHSAALGRLMSGSALFVDKPPLTAGYPDYAAMKKAGAPTRIRPSGELEGDD